MAKKMGVLLSYGKLAKIPMGLICVERGRRKNSLYFPVDQGKSQRRVSC